MFGKKSKISRRFMLSAAAAVISLGAALPVSTLSAAEVEQIHFLIPGGAGGGWDGTARGVGEALTKSGLLGSASYENMSGGGGGKAIAHLIETAERQGDTLMVNSTPIVIRSLTKVFPQSFRDLTSVAGVIGDYAAFAVAADSKYQSFTEVVADFKADPNSVKIGGGSTRGSMDHLVAAQAFKAAGGDPNAVKYIAYDAGGKAMAGLLSGETTILSTGLSEALELERSGQIRILGMTGQNRISDAPDVPTLAEQGIDSVFVNWRGFFAAPGTSPEKVKIYTDMLEKMYETADWETVRSRNGWVEFYRPGTEFTTFLEEQEGIIGNLMKELGFL
ncbi:tripartite tricarboxylate transporter substrate-binding protein [Kiloniella laminariae]|uniref:Tripartite tricarboxylate transporter substrate-binding protein n=1 Tax=Kiloniella laminariae TaxID=454162 RepID=A0ABT4LGK1_9PROT|nr:tripartite tricarboxylate transporter substrate-binding protein [Kiloniella laminariae]MCZ4280229.1 tripartite tricarboxylate transporter substrate-binding protein [Kiloniella laminariae]